MLAFDAVANLAREEGRRTDGADQDAIVAAISPNTVMYATASDVEGVRDLWIVTFDDLPVDEA